MKIYLAGRFQHRPFLREMRNLLVDAGYDVTSQWLTAEPETSAGKAFMDFHDVVAADVLILNVSEDASNTPTDGGWWVEYGVAYALKKTVIVVNPQLSNSIFLHLPGVIWTQDWDEILLLLDEVKEGSVKVVQERATRTLG